MKILRSRTWTHGAFIVLGSLLISGCGAVSVSSSHAQAPQSSTAISTIYAGGAANHTIIIPNNDMFAPYIAQLNVGDTVTWVNEDTVLHTILTSPTMQGDAVNPTQFQFVLGPGKSASLTLRQPGLYYYYCDAHATLVAGGPAAARTGVRAFPVPMDGFLYVLGQGISASANQTVNMSSDNRFAPWLTIINPGGVVRWMNQSQRAITLHGVPGYGLLNPTSLDLRVAPGSSAAITFQAVGIYDYYSVESAKVVPVWLRPEALPGVAGYPVPMEGIVAVFP
ncbi:MAG TPA: plastocyanin/azurin family copper-binding protein [Ktedonobacterales bacterium]|nr:plastocyanin/azurin family copper-binding protein [Ktedonobacterales bacterium]